MSDRETLWRMIGPPVRGRSCGSCKQCCTQVPVDLPDGHKEANQRCKHLCSKGCSIYAKRPRPCQVWSCRWLFDENTAELKRPDQSGYVIDAMTDTILAEGKPLTVVQVWVNPARRDAHRDPALRRYLAGIGAPAIIRWSSQEGMLLVPPALSQEGEWLELQSGLVDGDVMKSKLRDAGVNSRWT